MGRQNVCFVVVVRSIEGMIPPYTLSGMPLFLSYVRPIEGRLIRLVGCLFSVAWAGSYNSVSIALRRGRCSSQSLRNDHLPSTFTTSGHAAWAGPHLSGTLAAPLRRSLYAEFKERPWSLWRLADSTTLWRPPGAGSADSTALWRPRQPLPAPRGLWRRALAAQRDLWRHLVALPRPQWLGIQQS